MARLFGHVRVLGVAFLALVVLAVWFTYAIFTKQFADYAEVKLQTSTIGLQLPQRADVKIRGVLVGEVLETESNGDGAELTLGIYPDELDTIPEDVTGSIVPKTLFGEKYVSLVVPPDASAQPIRAGATIERTEVATEVEEVLADLYPLLETVQPADLNMTLNALATALEGRGEQLGETMETLDGYLRKFNPQLPALVEDLRLAAQVSDVYADVLPQIGTILQNTITTTGTLEDRAAKLNALFTEVTAFSDTARGFLTTNERNLIRIGQVSEPILQRLAKYSPMFPCLAEGITTAAPRQAETFRNYTLHIVLETLPNQPRPWNVNDRPRFDDHRGPTCLNLPNSPHSQANPFDQTPNFNDGVDEPTGKGTMRVGPGAQGAGFGQQGYAGSPAESAVLKSLLAPGLGSTPEEVDDLGVLLVGPMVRGATVHVGDPTGVTP